MIKTVEEQLMEKLDQLAESKGADKAEHTLKVLKASGLSVEEQLVKLNQALEESGTPSWRADRVVVEIRESIGQPLKAVKKNLGVDQHRESSDEKNKPNQLEEAFRCLGLSEAEAKIAAAPGTMIQEHETLYDQILKG